MTGGFRYEPASHERAVLELDGGGRVAYRDTRRFGTWLLTDTEDADRIIAVKNGPEPLERGFTTAFLAGRLARRTAPLKAAILDQRTVAGLGNIYADEALWHSRLHPQRPAGRDLAGRGRGATRGDPQGAAARHPPRRRDAVRPGVRRRRDAARVPRLRPRRRAVRAVRNADREDRRRRATGSSVLPAGVRPRAARRAGRRGRGARARCSRRSACRRSRICGTVQPPVASKTVCRKAGSSSSEISSYGMPRDVEQRLRADAVAAPAVVYIWILGIPRYNA